MQDNTGCSSRTTIYSIIDCFRNGIEVGSQASETKIRLIKGQALINPFSQVKAHCVMFPDVTIESNVRVGVCSLVHKSLITAGVYIGFIAKLLEQQKELSRKVLYK